MKVNKLLFISVLMFLLLLSLSSATIDYDTDVTTLIPLWNETASSTGLTDLSGNGNDGTSNGGVTFNSGKDAFDFDGTADYVNANSVFDTSSQTGVTISAWMKTSTNTDKLTGVIIGGKNSGGILLRFRSNGKFQGAIFSPDEAEYYYLSETSSRTINTFYHVVGVFEDHSTKIYVDGVEQTSWTVADSGSADFADITGAIADNLYIGGANGNTANDNIDQFLDGEVSDVFVFDRALTSTEISNLYSEGRNYNPYATTPVSDVNNSVESVTKVAQTGTVSFTGIPTTILSSTFNVTEDNSPYYGGISFNTLANNNNVIYCEIILDGVSVANTTRSNTGGVLGSIYLQHPVTLLSNSTSHTTSLVCNRDSGVGLTTVSNAIGSGHILINQDDEPIPYNTTSFDTAKAVDGFALLGNVSITIGNQSAVNNSHYLVVEGTAEYSTIGGSERIMNSYVKINDTNCSFYPRTVAADSSGVVGFDCIVANVTANATYRADFYGLSVSDTITRINNYKVNMVVKEFFLDDGEIIGGTGILNGTNFSGATETLLITTTGGNINHDEADVYNKLSYSVLTDVDTTVYFRIEINNSETFKTINWTRDFTAGDIGVVTGLDVFENVPKSDLYTVKLFANCGTIGATCQLVGGSSLGYITDITTTVFNAFNVTTYDAWSGNSLSSFNVTNGGFYDTTTGSVTVFTDEDLINLTVESNGYFPETITNHNTSLNLNQSMKQSDIKFAAYLRILGTVVTPANFTVDGVTKLDGESFYLSSGNYTATFDKDGFGEENVSFEVLSLDNKTVNITVGNAEFNITPYDVLTGASVSNFTVLVEREASNYSEYFNTTGSTLTVNLVQSDFVFTFIKDEYLNNTFNFTLTNTSAAVSIIVYPTNNVKFNFFDEVTLDPVLNVTFEVYGSAFSGNFSTSNSSYTINSLPNDIYRVVYGVDNSVYHVRNYHLVIPHRDEDIINVSLYLLNDSLGSLFVRRVVDQGSIPIDGYLELQRPYTNPTNDGFIYRTMEITSIDNQGDAVFFAIPNTQQYRFRVYNSVFTLIDTRSPEFLTETNSEFIVDEDANIMTNFNSATRTATTLAFQNSSDSFVLDYVSLNTIDGACLQVEYLFGTDQEITESCSDSASGTLTVFANTTGRNGTWNAWAVVNVGDQEYVVDRDSESNLFGDPSEALKYIGPFLYILLILLSITLAFVSKPVIGVAFGILGTAAFGVTFLGLLNISAALLGGLFVVGIVILVVMRER